MQKISICLLILFFASCQKYRPESEFIQLQIQVDSLQNELKKSEIRLSQKTDSLNQVIKNKDSVILLKTRKKYKSYRKNNKLNPIKRVQKVA